MLEVLFTTGLPRGSGFNKGEESETVVFVILVLVVAGKPLRGLNKHLIGPICQLQNQTVHASADVYPAAFFLFNRFLSGLASRTTPQWQQLTATTTTTQNSVSSTTSSFCLLLSTQSNKMTSSFHTQCFNSSAVKSCRLCDLTFQQ